MEKTITPDILKNNETPIVLPERTPDPLASSIINRNVFDEEKTKSQKTADTSVTDYTKILGDIAGVEAKSGQYQDELGREQRQSQLEDVNSAIYNTSREYKQYTENLRNNPNATQTVVGRKISEEQRKVASTLADMEFRKASIEGNLDRMKEKAQERIQLEVAPIKAKAEIAKFMLEKNFDNLSKVEQSRLSEIGKKAEAEAKKTEENLTKANEMYINAIQGKAPTSLIAKAKSIMDAGGSANEVASVLGSYTMTPLERLQLNKLNAEITKLNNENNQSNKVVDGVNEDLTAYASQYADTGKLPSPAELKLSGLSVGQVTSFAKQVPKPKGSIVSTLTGAKSGSVGATVQDDLQRLYNITELAKELEELDKKRVGGVISGVVGKVAGSNDQATYLTKRKAIVDDISRMQSGAALTDDEVQFYQDYLPGRFSEAFFLGQDSDKKIKNFRSTMENKLNNSLSNNGLSIYGFSNVKVGDTDRKVGDIIDIGGENYRVLPDGTLTDIL